MARRKGPRFDFGGQLLGGGYPLRARLNNAAFAALKWDQLTIRVPGTATSKRAWFSKVIGAVLGPHGRHNYHWNTTRVVVGVMPMMASLVALVVVVEPSARLIVPPGTSTELGHQQRLPPGCVG
jgi:hypothetical protein